MNKVLICDEIAKEGTEYLRKFATVDIKLQLEPSKLAKIVGGYDALIVRSQTKVTSEIIAAATNLRVIGRAGVGIDNIDVKAATKKGILVINSPEGNIVSTAEHTVALMFALSRHIVKAHMSLTSGTWDRGLKGRQLRNKTLGIIGLGRVGAEVAGMAQGLRMNVIAYDPIISQDRAERLGVDMKGLDDLIKQSDYVTVHVPLNDSTRNLISREHLETMKPTSVIINCARGGIIDESALREALDKGTIAGAAVDVFSKEPALDNVLLGSDKVVVTPHLAASTYEAEASAGIDIAEQIVEVLEGRPAKSPVNLPMISSEAMIALHPYIDVAFILGRIAVQLVDGQVQKLSIRYEGEITGEDTRVLKDAVLTGFLEELSEDRVNMINAELIARDRGIVVSEEKNPACADYNNMVVVEAITTSGEVSVGGTSYRGKTHLTTLNQFWLEIEPAGSYLLITEHKDRPGVIGEVGLIMGKHDINISQMKVSRGVTRGSNAMMVLCLDEPLPDDCRQQMLAISDMYQVQLVNLVN